MIRRDPNKPRKCANKACRKKFTPSPNWLTCCSTDCIVAVVRDRKAKAIRREQREGRERLKSRRDHEKEAQRAFNAFIRERDRFQGCISCHMPWTYDGQWHAGHYRTTAAAPQLRFNEDNCHKQCAQCNSSKSGNVVEYRLKLVARIGIARVEKLESDNAIAKLTADDLKAKRKHYQEARRAMKAMHDSAMVAA